MSGNIFEKRESALEYEFFHRVDTELLKDLKARLDFEKKEQALADATGITDEATLAELTELGIGTEAIFALSLFPLVWVAWADGKIQKREREAILDAAHSSGHERDTASHQLIEQWLEHEPEDKLRVAWKDYIHAICDNLSPAAKAALKNDVVGRTREVANSAGGILGFHKISDGQRTILEEVEAAFGDAKSS